MSVMVHIKELLLEIGESIPFGGSGFFFLEWSFTICLKPYNVLFFVSLFYLGSCNQSDGWFARNFDSHCRQCPSPRR